MSDPIGLQFGRNPESIVNQSAVGLQVQSGKTLALVGGDVALEGGILAAPDGRIELGSVAGNNLVSLTPTNTGYALGYEDVEDFQDIRLKQAAVVTTSGDNGGSIHVQGRDVTLADGSAIKAIVTGSGKGGSLSVTASESVQLIGTTADGQSPSALSTQTKGPGDAGDLVIETGRLIVRDGAEVSTQTEGAGDAGDLTIQTEQLIVRDGAQVSASTLGSGQGGMLNVNASNSVELIGTGSGLFAQANPGSTGGGGDLTITTERLIVQDSAQVALSSVGSGDTGNLEVAAPSISTAPALEIGGTITLDPSDIVPVPEPSSTLGILTFAAFSAAKVLKRKQRAEAAQLY